MASNEPGTGGLKERPRRTASEQSRNSTAPRPGPRTATARRRQKQQQQRLIMVVGGILVLLVVIVVAALLRQSSSNTGSGLADAKLLAPAQKPLSTGTVAPDFTLATVDGKKYTLSSDRGHPVLLEFFAIWCPHCQNMAPVIESVSSQFQSKGVHVLSVLANPYGRNYDSSGGSDLSLATAADMRWFQSNFAVQHPLLVDPKFTITNQYGAYSYPTLYVIDGKGIIRYSSYGEVPAATLSAALQKALAS